MSKRWGVWSRLFVVLGVLWTIGFPSFVWLSERADAMNRYAAGLQICYSLNGRLGETVDECLAGQRYHGPGADLFFGMLGIGVVLMLISIVIFLLVRSVIRWILAGRNHAQ